MRFITFSSFYKTALAPIYADLKILPLQEHISLQKAIFMHSLYYNTLPYNLSFYCNSPSHGFKTRYAEDGNFCLPTVKTNRGQTSIKYDGPKVWVDVPNELKEVAFRKSFSKKLKKHKIDIMVEQSKNIPRKSYKYRKIDFSELKAIFDDTENDDIEFFGFHQTLDFSELKAIFDSTENDDIEFLGFHQSLEQLFLSDDEDFDFPGFDVGYEALEEIFLSDDESSEFYGFNNAWETLKSIFDSDDQDETEFLGF